MNDHSKDSQTRYLREAAIVLAKEGFQSDEIHADRLCVLLDGLPLCEVTESGGITYRNEDIDEPERIDAKDKVYEIVKTTAEYMRQMETAPFLKADGLEDGYKVLADFNGTVLAGVQSKHGVHFVTWDWAYGHTGVCHGHYFMENYAGAKQDFAIRSGLIQKEQLFTPEQMTVIYRCCADSVDGDFFELTGEQEKMIRSVQQQIEECVPDLDERIRRQERGLGTNRAGTDNVISNGTGRSLSNKIPAFFHFREEFAYAVLFHARHAAAGVGAVDDVSARSKAQRWWNIPQPISLHARRCGVRILPEL